LLIGAHKVPHPKNLLEEQPVAHHAVQIKPIQLISPLGASCDFIRMAASFQKIMGLAKQDSLSMNNATYMNQRGSTISENVYFIPTAP